MAGLSNDNPLPNDDPGFEVHVDQLEPIAVVGFAMQFPQEATSAQGFWNILQEGRSVMTEVPQDRFNIDGFYHPDVSRPDTVVFKGGHFLSRDIAAFDAPFFSINPSEAESMDPQQRCLLETSYHALENAGVPIQKVAGSKTSVYVGSLGASYNQLFEHDEEIQPMYKATGIGGAIMSNRISWFYDLKGPSMTVDTACSSSLVGLHLACQSLRARESNMSLVCGSQLFLEPTTNAISLSSLQFMSPDSRCYSFDARGNGYAKGEGVGVLILKPLGEALASGDTIRAVIRATAVNQDGRTPGMTQPSPAAQEEQIRDAYRNGGLNLASTRFFEAHGTGTAVGDPIEAEAIKLVFQSHRSREEPMYVGAVKSNIGHLEAAAGIAGVIKAILCLEKGVIPPNADFRTTNPRIPADEWNLKFPTKAMPWPTLGLRRASVNSFGYGGTNAHVVIDDAYNYLRQRQLCGQHNTVEVPPAIESMLTNGKTTPDMTTDLNKGNDSDHHGHVNGGVGYELEAQPYVFVLSASDPAGIERLASAYEDYLSQTIETPDYLRNLAYTLSAKRSTLPWKIYINATSLEGLRSSLSRLPVPARSSVIPKLNFIFTGQGAQWAEMGLGLLIYPEFRESLNAADIYFQSLGCNWSLIEEISKPANSSRIDDPSLAQPICTALQVALVELLSACGIHSSGIAGHSSGEIAAAFCASAISRQYAWKIAYFRGLLAARLAVADAQDCGAMMSVQLSEVALQPYFEKIAQEGQGENLEVGCQNSPSYTTVTGLESSIDRLKYTLDKDGIYCRKLRIPVAYHSTRMQVIAKEYLDILQSTDRSSTENTGKSSPQMVSSATGNLISHNELAQPEYWVRNLVSKVKFSEAMHRLHLMTPSNQTAIYIEIGPSTALKAAIKDSISSTEEFNYESTLRRGMTAVMTLAFLAGRLTIQGYPVILEAVNSHGSVTKPARMLTDLPEYPFNHSRRYWLDSRLFRNFRQRHHPRHELLGLPSTDWNPGQPRWRHTIRKSDLLWLDDHQVNGSVVYPAAGILAMAIEAVRSISKAGSEIRGYRFRDVTIFNALIIPSDSEALEIELYMRNQRNSRSTSIPSIECREFSISSCADDEWREACQGTIVTEYAESPNEIYDAKKDALISREHANAKFNEIATKCPAKASRERFYRIGREMGYDFGPTFQTLHGIAYDPAGYHAVGDVILDEWATKSAKTSVQNHVIHPTALDGVLQTVAVMNNRGGTIVGPLQAPTEFRELWVSHSLLSRSPGARIRVAAKIDRVAIRDVDTSIISLHSETGEPVITMDGYRSSTISSHHYVPSERRNIFYALEWQPDVDLLGSSEKEEHCLREAGASVDWDPSQQAVCLYYMTEALRELEAQGFKTSKPHLQKYLDWAYRHLDWFGNQNPILMSPWKESFSSGQLAQYMAQFAARGPAYEAVYRFCSQLTDIVRGDVDPLDLLFNQGLAKDLYADQVFVTTGNRLAAFVSLVSHKNPNMDILEVGAGTGTATDPILSALSQIGQRRATPRYNSYTFTDISPSFFDKAMTRFANQGDRMSFKTLDIEQHPGLQGFEMGKYDMVVAAMVLHATATVMETLENIRYLLKPGGYLVMIEPTNKNFTVSDCIWGTLPGWWRGTEEDRQLSPLYTRSEWESCLRDAGFASPELTLYDYAEAEHHMLSMLVSRVAQGEPSSTLAPTTVIIAGDTDCQQQVAGCLAVYIREKGAQNCDIVSPQLLCYRHDVDLCVFLLDLEQPFLSSMTDDEFAILKKIVSSSKQVYWLTNGAGAEARQPEKAMASGFSRAIMQEYPGLQFTTIDVDNQMDAVRVFQMVYERSLLATNHDEWESDYRHHNGVVSIPRVAEADGINAFVHSQTGQLELEMRKVEKEAGDALQLEFSFGQLDGFRFAADVAASEPLAANEVEVEIKATGINFTDVLVILGHISGTYVGCEYSGVIRRVGSAVTAHSPGDRVCFIGGDGFKTFVRAKEYALASIPDSLPFTEAFAAIYLTVIYAINHLGRLRRGESILIHAAAGGVGQAAIKLAQHIGADLFVTVSSRKKKELVQELYGIPDNRVFFSRDLSFGRQIMHATNGHGIDVVLNSVSGEGLAESWRVIAPLGRFIELGKRDIYTFQSLPMQPFMKNVSYHSVDLTFVGQHSPALMGQMTAELEDMLAKGIFATPRPLSVFSRAEFESAIRYLQTGRHMGKVVIDWEAEAEIPVVPSSAPEYFFDPEASYMIAGGLGGIGRSLASWFASRGARHLILLSRSGPTSDSAIKLLEDLAGRGVNVATPRCNITSANAVREALQSTAETMPPVKGCIQGSMVLQDRLLENMTREGWQAVLDPKISGTWNLHHALPKNMDFFVILSSLGGMIGSKGQSQYNAASTFQDAFARHRWSRGEKCVSIDIGVVTGVGYVAEHADVSRRWAEKGTQTLNEQELHSIIDWACHPDRQISSPWSTQVIVGAGSTGQIDERAMESLPHLRRPLYRRLYQMRGKVAVSAEASAKDVDYEALLSCAGSLDEAGSIIAAALVKRLARALSLPEEDIDTSRPIHLYGVDSLVAVELRFWFSSKMNADISVFSILSNDSLLSLSQLAASKSEYSCLQKLR